MWRTLIATDITIGILAFLLAGAGNWLTGKDKFDWPMMIWVWTNAIVLSVGFIGSVLYTLWHWALK